MVVKKSIGDLESNSLPAPKSVPPDVWNLKLEMECAMKIETQLAMKLEMINDTASWMENLMGIETS